MFQALLGLLTVPFYLILLMVHVKGPVDLLLERFVESNHIQTQSKMKLNSCARIVAYQYLFVPGLWFFCVHKTNNSLILFQL
jgi:hypothetical protein